MRYLLIDYESLQPPDLAGLQGEDVRVLVFVGAQQNRIPFDFANAMQQLGERGRYVKIGGPGATRSTSTWRSTWVSWSSRMRAGRFGSSRRTVASIR